MIGEEMVEVKKKYVYVTSTDGISIRAAISLPAGQGVSDIINNSEKFIILNEAEIDYLEDVQSFRLTSRTVQKKNNIVLNKSFIKWIIEL